MKPILYTTHCPKCSVLEKKLKQAGVNYEICEDIETMQNKNIDTAPALEINGQLLNFIEAVKWVGEHS